MPVQHLTLAVDQIHGGAVRIRMLADEPVQAAAMLQHNDGGEITRNRVLRARHRFHQCQRRKARARQAAWPRPLPRAQLPYTQFVQLLDGGQRRRTVLGPAGDPATGICQQYRRYAFDRAGQIRQFSLQRAGRIRQPRDAVRPGGKLPVARLDIQVDDVRQLLRVGQIGV